MSDFALTVRPLQADDADELVAVVHRAFLADMTPAGRDRELLVFEPGRFHGVFDSRTMIGAAGMLTRTMTVPGLVQVPVAAVTSVGVLPDHRRRGALSMLMRAQLHGLHESGGDPIAALWASQTGIYGRFGYGLASRRWRMTVRRPVTFSAPAAEGAHRVRLLDAESARAALQKLHSEYASNRVGGLSRPEQAWKYSLADDEDTRDGATALHYAVHHGGYALFRIKEDWRPSGAAHEMAVQELVPTTSEGHAALWRFLLDIELVGEVRYANTPTDDPLPLMLTDLRAAHVELADALFVRLVDVERALAARRYLAPADVVFELTDGFCPWNAGRWRLVVDESGVARVDRTNDEPDVACDVADLGAAYLGSTRLPVLAAAGRVRELRAGALRVAAAAFGAEHEPHCLEAF